MDEINFESHKIEIIKDGKFYFGIIGSYNFERNELFKYDKILPTRILISTQDKFNPTEKFQCDVILNNKKFFLYCYNYTFSADGMFGIDEPRLIAYDQN